MTTTTNYATDDDRWRAVLQRDRGADGTFVYSVKTTGVYCRPACPSRRPNRDNVRFFATCKLAERAGFRACKKCDPKGPAAGTVPEAVAAACRLIQQAETPPRLGELAEAVGLSPFHLHRLFKRTLGVTPKAYAMAQRLRRFRDGLSNGRNVTKAMVDAGFASSSRLYEGAADALGMTPTQYRNGASGLTIRFATADCSLGRVIVAGTEAGVCAIEFGDADDSLIAGLRERFPRAELRPGDSAFAKWVATVVSFVEAPTGGLALPLDVRGTAFQRQVWEALRAIPAGVTATYAEVARRIGKPKALRAVAAACAANRLAVAVPCHRVVRSDGDVGGYRWGTARKAELLRREASRSVHAHKRS
ncbi:MAG: bifunctional DNA-binding transcriptional regulator/O6-methylguanine-DNA methyltransferase Ada [Gemmataceae bacterium]